MAPKKITVTLQAARIGALNSLNVISTTDSSPDANIKTKSVVEIYAKATPLPQQVLIASPILVESTEKSASQKRSTTSTINSSDVMPVMMAITKATVELDALKLQLEALNHALQEKDNQIAYLMNMLDSMTGKSQMFEKDESTSKGFMPLKEMQSKGTQVKVIEDIEVKAPTKKIEEGESSSTKESEHDALAKISQTFTKKIKLHFVHVSKGQDDQSSSSNPKDIIQGLKDLTLPVNSLVSPKVFKSPLKGLTRPSKSLIVELRALPAKRTSVFDPNAYKLLAKAGYGSIDVAKLTKDFKNGDSEQSSTAIRKVWKDKNTGEQGSNVGLGYQALAPLRLKIRRETSNHISVEEIEDIKSEISRPSIFSRLGVSSNRISVFDPIGILEGMDTKKSRTSIHQRLGISKPSKGKKNKKKQSIVTINCLTCAAKFPLG
ncbi:hypothetical protein JCGZ_27124 [Jatropha curcas]|uniref:Uncharacterized protein n=1 Tax=Jatropha curcas TaxID=180498 RepID=A0A067JV17_JATCU|nr:hypothetical protein JCGZ_27124 [Jatropha curcas]